MLSEEGSGRSHTHPANAVYVWELRPSTLSRIGRRRGKCPKIVKGAWIRSERVSRSTKRQQRSLNYRG